MNNLYMCIVAITIFYGFAGLGSAQSTNKLSNERDLKAYQLGPTYDRLIDFHHPEATILEYAQKYLWKVWSEKTKAHFEFIEYGREGDQVRKRFFVEPDSSNRWRVAVATTVYSCRTYNPPESCRTRVIPSEKYFDSVKWDVKKIWKGGKEFVTTNIAILVLHNSTTGDEFVLERGGLF